MITIAIPKGRLFRESVELLHKKGIIDHVPEEGRKLIIETGKVNLLLVKPFDLPLYVESGVSDLGICGLDVYLELKPEVYRFLDLGIGKCRISVAGRKNDREKLYRCPSPKVATKYPNITREFFGKRGVRPQILTMSGSVELGAVLKMADLIIDLVQTGRTLRENGLTELEVIGHSSAWLICNRASFRNKREEVINLLKALQTEQ